MRKVNDFPHPKSRVLFSHFTYTPSSTGAHSEVGVGVCLWSPTNPKLLPDPDPGDGGEAYSEREREREEQKNPESCGS